MYEERDDRRPTPFTDEELSFLALSCDPDAPIDPDAVPLELHGGETGTLPVWYMPEVARQRFRRWQVAVVLAIVVALLMIEAVGLCSTYGPVISH